MSTWLLFGGNGWIGTQIATMAQERGDTVHIAKSRADDVKAAEAEIAAVSPDVVMSCLGRTHGPGCDTIDYLETRLHDNVRDNLFAPLALANICASLGVYYVYLGTGCIFEGEGFTEDSEPNFFGSGYSIVKGFTDRLFHNKPSVLNVRIRMPITGEAHARNFITKITKYDRVINIPNSMTVLPSLLPHLLCLIDRRITGTLNFTNPGAISHNEILDMYCDIVDPSFRYKNFSVEEQDRILASRRSNNILNTSRLEELCPGVENIREAVRKALLDYRHSCITYKPKRLLLTGACGFIGSAFLTYLFETFRDYHFVNVDCLTYAAHEDNIPRHIQESSRYAFVKADIVNVDAIKHIIAEHRIDTIVHLAAESHVDKSFDASLEFTKTNALGTHCMLQAALFHSKQVHRFMHVSTDEVYGDVDYTEQVTEQNRMNPTNPYAASKVAAEQMVGAYGRCFGIPVVITRCNNVYGPRQYPEKLIPKFALQTMNGLPMTIHGLGNTKRSFMYIDDVVRAFSTILHKGQSQTVYNVGIEQEISVIEVSRMICDHFGDCNIPGVEYVGDRKFNDQRYYINSDKVRALGWKPVMSFAQGLRLTLDWYQSNGSYWPDSVLDTALKGQV